MSHGQIQNSSESHEDVCVCVVLWVIPCQINKQNVFASQISTKLGGLVPSMKLFNHAYFGRVKLYGFGNIGPTFF